MSFFDAEATGLALQKSGMTSERYILHLVNLMENAEKEGDQIRAAKLLRDILKENLELSGVLQTAESQLVETADGQMLRRTVSSKHLLRALAEHAAQDPSRRDTGVFIEPRQLEAAHDPQSIGTPDSDGTPAPEPAVVSHTPDR